MENDLRNQLLDKSRKFEADLDSSICYSDSYSASSIKNICERIFKDRGINLVIKVIDFDN